MTSFTIPDMSCGHCRRTVEAAIRSVDPQARIDVDLAARTASVETTGDLAAIGRALETAGYPATT